MVFEVLTTDTAVVLDKFSTSDAGFANPDTGGDTHPFNSGENIQYTVQSPLTAGSFTWRVRGADPLGYGAWSSTRSFTAAAPKSAPIMDSSRRLRHLIGR